MASNVKYKFSLNEVIYVVGILLIFELVLCGSGQIMKIGPLTFRMVLYVFGVLLSATVSIRYRYLFSTTDIYLFEFSGLLFLFNIAIGLINGAPISMIIEDIKPFSYIFILPFLIILINSDKVINVINKILRFGPLMLACIYILYLIIVRSLGIVTFGEVYDASETQSDFMFRGTRGELFYKGFIYLPIGFLFWLKKKKYLPLFIIGIAIYYTLTRGFYIITLIGIIMFLFSTRKNAKQKLIIGGLCFFLLVCVLMILPLIQMDDRASGDQIRILTTKQVFEEINAFSVIIGHGYGIGVPVREIHMENSYLEIFHKSGVLGLGFWYYLFFCIYRYYLKTTNKNITMLYYIGTVMIYIQSLFNPFINNSIGMGFVLISYCIMKYYSEYGKNSSLLCNI